MDEWSNKRNGISMDENVKTADLKEEMRQWPRRNAVWNGGSSTVMRITFLPF